MKDMLGAGWMFAVITAFFYSIGLSFDNGFLSAIGVRYVVDNHPIYNLISGGLQISKIILEENIILVGVIALFALLYIFLANIISLSATIKLRAHVTQYYPIYLLLFIFIGWAAVIPISYQKGKAIAVKIIDGVIDNERLIIYANTDSNEPYQVSGIKIRQDDHWLVIILDNKSTHLIKVSDISRIEAENISTNKPN